MRLGCDHGAPVEECFVCEARDEVDRLRAESARAVERYAEVCAERDALKRSLDLAEECVLKWQANFAEAEAFATRTSKSLGAAESENAALRESLRCAIRAAWDGPEEMVGTGCKENYREWRERMERIARAALEPGKMSAVPWKCRDCGSTFFDKVASEPCPFCHSDTCVYNADPRDAELATLRAERDALQRAVSTMEHERDEALARLNLLGGKDAVELKWMYDSCVKADVEKAKRLRVLARTAHRWRTVARAWKSRALVAASATIEPVAAGDLSELQRLREERDHYRRLALEDLPHARARADAAETAAGAMREALRRIAKESPESVLEEPTRLQDIARAALLGGGK